jgi:membrane protease subunit HflK
MPDSLSPDSSFDRDPYRGVILVLMAAALLGAVGAFAGGVRLANPVLLDVALTLALSSGILFGVMTAQTARANRTESDDRISSPPEDEIAVPAPEGPAANSRLKAISVRIWRRLRRIGAGNVRARTAAAGVLAVGLMLFLDLSATPAGTPLVDGIAVAICLIAAGLAATAAHYLAGLDTARLPEAPGLLRGARVVAWILVLAAVSIGLAWAGQQTILRILHFALLGVNAAVCYGLMVGQRPAEEAVEVFPLDLAVLSILGTRTNILASVVDAAERQLGIDLRSTWALTVVRRGLEPLVIGLCLLGWLTTSLTVVGVEEQALVERLGVPVGGQPLPAGIHLHWPWPVDRVIRIPVQRVAALTVGHEGEEGGGPENVLWARQHAANEYTLLLGNGRDLITVDATVQFRVVNARAWRYNCQNPADALRALAYRAVMRNTVNRTLSEALSENVATLTARMRAMVQENADALGLGVEVLAFTVGGMHPPTAVAGDYQAVVSAELQKVTAVVNAQVFRNQTLPAAETSVLVGQNAARAEAAEGLAKAAGEAWSFRTLESQYRAAPGEYFFRRRLETLEKGLADRSFTVVDSRFQRDGGELWVIP